MNQLRVYMCPSSWTPLPPSSPIYPSGLSQCTGFKCPVSYIELELVIYFTYGNIHVSVLFSQIIPPSLSPTDEKICSLYLCLLCCLTYRVIIIIFPNSRYMCSIQFSSVTQSCLTLCDPMNHSTPGLLVHHQLPELTQIHVLRVGDAIQPSHPLSYPSLAPNPSQHQGLYNTVYMC